MIIDILSFIHPKLGNKWIDLKFWWNPEPYRSGGSATSYENMKITDYTYWDSIVLFSTHQASCLVHGFSPGFSKGSYPEYVIRTERDMIDKYFDQEFGYHSGRTDPDIKNEADAKRARKFREPYIDFLIDEIQMFCELEAIDSAFVSRELREKNEPSDIELSHTKAKLAKVEYLNPAHTYYAPQLAEAVDAWKDLFENGEFEKIKDGRGPYKAIKAWLDIRMPDSDNEPRKRIAKMINPEKGGGAPKTGKQ